MIVRAVPGLAAPSEGGATGLDFPRVMSVAMSWVCGVRTTMNGPNASVALIPLWRRSAPRGRTGASVPLRRWVARPPVGAAISDRLAPADVRRTSFVVRGIRALACGPMTVRDYAPRAEEPRRTVHPAIVALVPFAAAGDEAAFTRLVETFHADMARVAYVICGGNRELAEDAVQSAWTIAWTRLGTLREPDRIRAWLLAITANEARQALRQQRRVAVFGLEFAEERVGAPDPYRSPAALEMTDVLARLKPEERTLIGLRYAAGLDSAEIGAVLGMSASGVRSRLDRLLDRMRSELEHE